MTRRQLVPQQTSPASPRQQLAHKLLIELLSHQLAFPVRWIETQDELLGKTPSIERYVEVGPSRVLANMAKKQAAKGLQDPLVTRQYLSSSDNRKEIFYHYDEQEVEQDPALQDLSPPEQASPSASVPTQAPAAPVPVATAPPSTAAPVAAAPALEDKPLAVGDILLPIVARKLRKQFDQVPADKSIRDLSGGKSTLQNEIIGDLGVELGNLPDGSEDMPLSALTSALADAFQGQPGKEMSALVAKLISSKMPASFNQQAIRQHLNTRWGLGPQRQTTILCLAITFEPPSRLASIDAGREFFDTVAQRYAAFYGVSLSAPSAAGSAASPSAMVDAAALESARKEHKESLRKIHRTLTQLLDDPRDGQPADALAEAESFDPSAQNRLDHWTSEFGEKMFTGTTPVFDVRKVRVYDSWWNWVRVDLVSLKHELERGDMGFQEAQDRIRMILNRWTSASSPLLQALPAATTVTKQLEEHTQPATSNPPVWVYTHPVRAPRTTITAQGETVYEEVARHTKWQGNSFAQLVHRGLKPNQSGVRMPVIQLKSHRPGDGWHYHGAWTDRYMEALLAGETSGLSFAGNIVLVTGAGPGSIASEIVRGLLEGGAEVLVTTSRPPPSTTTEFFRDMYRRHGSKGSKLVVLPFNQGSKQDCEALVNHIYTNQDGYGGDLDSVIPFAAIGEAGQLDGLDAQSELAHRLMLTNLLRLLGYIKQCKEERKLNTRPTNVILPLSPNHGTFGGDGLYPESKLGLETLFNRFHSESWSDYVTLTGAVIGWTRGTGLMNSNNVLAETVESAGAITFSSAEMAFSILALINPDLMAVAEQEPILADLSGNLSAIPDFKALLSQARRQLSQQSRLQQALHAEAEREKELMSSPETSRANRSTISPLRHRHTLQVDYPNLPAVPGAAGLPNLRGMVDLTRTIVVVGYSELGPWGSARTRWEKEHSGDFTDAGLLELAWIMGLIDHFDGDLKGAPYVGWVDTKTKEPIHDDEIRARFGTFIQAHTGIRTIEPAILNGYDPRKKELLHEMVMDEDLPPFEASRSTAEAFRLQHQEKVEISPIAGSEEYQVCIKRGARLLVPKAIAFNRTVAGLLPTGWDPARYGIPEDIISQVDPTTLYVLCCVCEAMYSAGIEDPFEIYQHLHVSELANCIGTGAGGLTATRKMYRERYLENPVQSDIFQETFLNAMSAWTNLLLLASAGPLKTPSGTCATSIESMDSGCEALLLGKAKMAFVGGTDDFREEASYEFGNMRATVNTDEEALAGRPPHEMSRPSTTTRSGFMESAGCGVQIITTAEMALEMGLPIYGIVAHTQMAGDRIGRSVPAPGQGVLTAAREVPDAAASPLLNLEYRRGKLNEALQEIDAWWVRQLQLVQTTPDAHAAELLQSLERTRQCRITDAQHLWGSGFRRLDPRIAPLRAALAVWGLTVDDIQSASLHGTSTKANDKNEADVLNKQMRKLGRSPGHPLLTISQKYLTGHPKGAAGAWMFNGGLQVLQTGIVPGNRNADNVAHELQAFEHLLYPDQTIHTAGIKAFMLTSFGFGQKGGIAVAIAPRYLFAALPLDQYSGYRDRVLARQQGAQLSFVRGIMTQSLFKAKTESPWQKEDETAVFLDPRARAIRQPTGNFAIRAKDLESSAPTSHIVNQYSVVNQKQDFLAHLSRQFLQTSTGQLDEAASLPVGVGTDVETVTAINIHNRTFVDRNFTAEEQGSAFRSADPQAFFAGRWSAKEAIFKSLGVASRGAGAPMKEIEVINDAHGVPQAQLHGEALQAARSRGISDFRISISHCADTVMAVALAVRE
ncbi:hypothetical protein BDV25DRAFT_136581 [Aspergillus avenaceus]|uniref:Fatty acid synthase subunit alpha n=1 Tax=Aspergillus avenaceus TaxID=36643 RepID=A0A5N6U5I5_ASPAV|nr:hypothetical protein BDV25DRAFT_136581 [Aspergillus avenaceus]